MENNKLFKLNTIETIILLYLILISFLYKEKLTIDYNVFIIGVVIFVFSIFFNYKKFLLSFPFLLPFQYKGIELYNIHLSITDIAIILLLISFILRAVYFKRALNIKNYFFMLIAFLLISFSSMLFSNKIGNFYLNYFFRFIECIIIFFIFVMEVRTKDELVNLSKNFFYIAIFISTYNIYEFIFIRRGYNLLNNIADFNFFRVLGVSSQPNFTGIFLALVFPVGIFFCKNHKLRTLFVFFTTTGIFLTFSRAAIFLFFFQIIFLSYLNKKVKLIIIFSMIIIMVGLPQIINSRKKSVDNRLYRYLILPKMFSEAPIIGTGLRTYSEEFSKLRPDIKSPSAHSTFLKVLVETGFLGAFVYFGFLILIFSDLAKSKFINNEDKNLFIILILSLMFANLFAVMLVHQYFWMLLIIVANSNFINGEIVYEKA